MPLRRVTAGLAAIVLFAAGVAAALAEPPTTTTDATTTTAPPTTGTTATSSTTTTSTTGTTTTAATTTVAPPTTMTEVTTTAARSTTTSTAAATPAQQFALDSGCPIGGIALLLPKRPPAILGAIANTRSKTAQFGGLVYPAGGSVATASAVTLSEQACTNTGPTTATAQLQNVSLLNGAVTARVVALRLSKSDSASVSGLVVEGRQIGAVGEQRIALQSWGYVVTGSHVPLAAPGGAQAVAALALHLTRARAGLPAGTAILVAVAGVRAGSASATSAKRPVAHRHKKPRRATHEPLKVTPPLGLRHYVFPVVGPSDYIDTYGAFRSDVPGNWHHGDDIFAPLGTPVVAVASGTINRVGWEVLGGWRLWVRDPVGDEFYYAHLSGYAPTDLRTNRVTAGEVIGFIGNTGDAFTTSPHLHFEVHPRPLLHLGYDGAVDPTTYLNGWTHLEHVDAPRPIHPPLPKLPLIRREASYVFRELLAARHLIRHAPKPNLRPQIAIPAGANGPLVAPRPSAGAATPTVAAGPKGTSTLTVTVITVLSGLALLAAVTLLPSLRQRLRRGGTPADESGAPVAAAGRVEDESSL